jgi:hypothetical protein
MKTTIATIQIPGIRQQDITGYYKVVVIEQ